MNKPLESGLGGTHFIRIDPQRCEFLVPRWAFTDQAVLDKEREEIFARCWLYVGHASEIPKVGDFVARKVGGRQLFLWRGEDGMPRVYFNTCTHRGAMVCREKQGNAKRLTCPYHGWTFDTRGGMVEQPGASGFPDDFFANGAKDLISPAKVEAYRDFVFVNFDPNAVDLTTYLAGAAEYLDLVADQGGQGMEVTPGEQAYSMRANWKLLYENSADGYHAITAHASYFDYLRATVGVFREDFDPHDVGGGGKSLGNGHAVIEYQAPWGRPVAQWVPQWGESGRAEIARVKAELAGRLGEQRADRIANWNRNILIFPNLIINDIMGLTIRSFQPVTPGYLEVTAWSLAPRGEHPEMRAWRQYNFNEFLGPAGFATPDDVEMLELCQQAYQNMPEVAWNDISKGMNRPDANQGDDEVQMRSFWMRWDELMGAAG